MKYSILGFNQSRVVDYFVDIEVNRPRQVNGEKQEVTEMVRLACDLLDIHLLNYIMYAQGSPKMTHIVKDEISYVWLCHSHILEDLPILRIAEGTLRNRLVKLRQMKLIDSVTIANSKGRGSHTFYTLTKTAGSMLYETEENTTSFKNDSKTQTTSFKNDSKTQTTSFKNDSKTRTTSFKNDSKTRPRHLKMTPDNTLIIDNKVNNDNKVCYSEKTSFSHSQNNNNDFSLNNKPKQKKETLWDKCFNELCKFTKDEKLKNKLVEYLNVWIKLKDKHPNLRNWQSILKKLQSEYIKEDWIAIIDQSIRKEYATFCPLISEGNRKPKKLFDEGIRNDGRYDLENHSLTDMEF